MLSDDIARDDDIALSDDDIRIICRIAQWLGSDEWLTEQEEMAFKALAKRLKRKRKRAKRSEMNGREGCSIRK